MEEHRPRKLLDQVRDAIRLKHYSYRTQQGGVGWFRRCSHVHHVRHPSEMGAVRGKPFSPTWPSRKPRRRKLPKNAATLTFRVRAVLGALTDRKACRLKQDTTAYLDGWLLFAITPRTKRTNGMKQISPIANTTITSATAKGAVVRIGCNSKKTISAMNNMLA